MNEPRPGPADEPQGPWVRKARKERKERQMAPWVVAAVAVVVAFAAGIAYASDRDSVSPQQRAAVDHWYLAAGGKQQWEAVAAAAASGGGSGDDLTTAQLRVRCSNQIRAADSALAFQPIPDSVAHRHWTDYLLGTKDSSEKCIAAIDQDSDALMRQASDAGFAAGAEMDALTARLNEIHYSE